MNESVIESMTKVFLEQPLTSPWSAKYGDNMSQLWDEIISQLKSSKFLVLEQSLVLTLSRHHNWIYGL